MTKDDGGPAFAATYTYAKHGAGGILHPEGGMTLRDWYAGQIAASMISGRSFWSPDEPAEVARDAYAVADAMLAARAKDKETAA